MKYVVHTKLNIYILIIYYTMYWLYCYFIGDKLIMASTDYDWKQAEEVEVIQCDSCSDYQVRLSGKVAHELITNDSWSVDAWHM